MGQLLAPRAFGSKKCVVLAFVVSKPGQPLFSFWPRETSRNPGFLRGILVVHVETPSCSVVSGAVLCKTITMYTFFKRGDLLIFRVHYFGLECIKKCAL